MKCLTETLTVETRGVKEAMSENPEVWTCREIRQRNRKDRDTVDFEGERYYLCEFSI